MENYRRKRQGCVCITPEQQAQKNTLAYTLYTIFYTFNTVLCPHLQLQTSKASAVLKGKLLWEQSGSYALMLHDDGRMGSNVDCSRLSESPESMNFIPFPF